MYVCVFNCPLFSIQAQENIMNLPLTNGWGGKHQLFVKWKYAEAKVHWFAANACFHIFFYINSIKSCVLTFLILFPLLWTLQTIIYLVYVVSDGMTWIYCAPFFCLMTEDSAQWWHVQKWSNIKKACINPSNKSDTKTFREYMEMDVGSVHGF